MYREARRSSKNLGELSTSQCLQLGQLVTVEMADSQCKKAVDEAKGKNTLYQIIGIAITALHVLAYVLYKLWQRFRIASGPSRDNRPQLPALEFALETPILARPTTPVQKRTRRKTAEVRIHIDWVSLEKLYFDIAVNLLVVISVSSRLILRTSDKYLTLPKQPLVHHSLLESLTTTSDFLALYTL